MKCYCYETDSKFIFCVEEVKETQLENAIQHMAWKKNDNKFLLSYPLNAFSNQEEKELISGNFNRLGQAMFESSLVGFDWKKPLKIIAQKFNENKIEWYIVGSIGDVIRGVDVQPFDIDLVVHTRDYSKAKDICYANFSDSIVAPFTNNHELFLRYFGRLFLAGAMVEVVADERWNLEIRQQEFGEHKSPVSEYEKATWNGNDVFLESMKLRHLIEIMRNRKDRVKAIE